MARRAATGFAGVALSPVEVNTILAYESLGGQDVISLPFAGGMTRTARETSQDFYYDDKIYGQAKEHMGDDVELRFAEVELAKLEKLGLGTYDATTGRFEGDFAVKGRLYSLRCVTDTLDRLPFFWNYRVFDLNGIKYDNFSTKGSSIAICEIIVTGVLIKPSLATLKPYVQMQLLEDQSNLAECQAVLADGEQFPEIP